MAHYRYRVVDTRGRVKTGKMDASNEADLEMRLRKTGLELVSCKAARSKSRRFPGRRVSRRDLILFCFHLQQTMQANVPILESLKDLRDSVDNPRLREVSAEMLEAIEGGRTLSEAMRNFPGVFTDVFTNLVQAGEQIGDLDSILGRLGENLKWQDEQASTARKLILYPAFTGAVIVAVVFFLMLYLVPELLAFVKTTGSELPAHTLLLISVSGFFTHYWHAMLLAPALMIGCVVFGGEVSPGIRLALDRLKLKIPVLGPMLQKLILARFSGFFAMMYSSGIPIIDCLGAGERIVGNRVVGRAMKTVGRAVADGKSLGEGFALSGLFPPLVLRMIRVGETTGALQASLENVAYFYTRDVRESVDRLQSMIEPAMTLILGSIIGWVMLSVLGPIYDLITNLGL